MNVKLTNTIKNSCPSN